MDKNEKTLEDNSANNLDLSKPRLLEIVKTWGLSTSTHGIPNIIRNHHLFIKLMWIFCFLACFGYMTFGLVNIIQDYLSYEPITKMEFIRHASLEFPTVTICNKSPLNTNDENFVKFKKIFDGLKQNFYGKVKGTQNINNYMLFFQQYSKLQVFLLSNNTEKKKMSYSVDDMLINCQFNSIGCSKKDFEYYYTNSYGNCYKFNSGLDWNNNKIDIKSSTNPGRQNALNFILYTGKPNDEYLFQKSDGIILFIHNSTTIPLTQLEGISLSPGYETDIVINQVEFNRLSKPYSDCIIDTSSPNSFDSNLYKSTFNSIKVYRQKFCLQLCYQEYLIEKCNCSDINVPTLSGVDQPCLDEESLNCALARYNEFYTGTNLNQKCIDECPQECNSVNFNLATLQADYPSKFYSELIIAANNNSSRNLTTYEDVKTSTLSVNIYYDDLIKTLINEVEPQTIDGLIANFGGIIGLCIGSSLLSIVELIELFLELIFYFSLKK